MNYKQRTHIVSLILAWPLIMIIIYLDFDLLDIWNIGFFENMNGLLKFLFVAATAFVLAFLLSLFLMNAFPITKNQIGIMMELEQNGYTQRFFELSEKEINRIISAGRVYKDYRVFAQYVIYQADGYLFNDNVYAAVNCIGRVNLKDLQTYLKKYDKNTILGYFDVQMAICLELNDQFRAEAVMQDAAPYIQKENGKLVMFDMMINEIYTIYHILKGDMNKAMEYAQSCIIPDAKEYRIYIGNLLIAKVLLKSGKINEAAEHAAVAEKYAVNQLRKQALEKIRRDIDRVRAENSVFQV